MQNTETNEVATIFPVTESVEVLDKMIEGLANSPLLLSRARFIRCIKGGLGYAEIEEAIGVKATTLFSWYMEYISGGIDSLVTVRATKSKKSLKKLTPEIIEKVRVFMFTPRTAEQIHEFVSECVEDRDLVAFSNSDSTRAALARDGFKSFQVMHYTSYDTTVLISEGDASEEE